MLLMLIFIIKVILAVVITHAVVVLLLDMVLSVIYAVSNGLGRFRKARR